jgi:hypothetical protein
VSEFLTPFGRLGDSKAVEIMKYSGRIWWNGDKLLEQVIDKAIPASEAQFPGCKALFGFDNARNHLKFANNALHISEINLEAGEINPKIIRNIYVVNLSYPNSGYTQG